MRDKKLIAVKCPTLEDIKLILSLDPNRNNWGFHKCAEDIFNSRKPGETCIRPFNQSHGTIGGTGALDIREYLSIEEFVEEFSSEIDRFKIPSYTINNNKVTVRCHSREDYNRLLATDTKNTNYGLAESHYSVYGENTVVVPFSSLYGSLDYHTSDLGLKRWDYPISVDEFIAKYIDNTDFTEDSITGNLVTLKESPYKTLFMVIDGSSVSNIRVIVLKNEVEEKTLSAKVGELLQLKRETLELVTDMKLSLKLIE